MAELTAARRNQFRHQQHQQENQTPTQTLDNTNKVWKNTRRQRKITEYITHKYVQDQGSGQIITTKTTDQTLQCFIQNPDGILNYGQTQDTEAALQQLKQLRVDVIILIETN